MSPERGGPFKVGDFTEPNSQFSGDMSVLSRPSRVWFLLNAIVVGGWTNHHLKKYARQFGSFPQVSGWQYFFWNHQLNFGKMCSKTLLNAARFNPSMHLSASNLQIYSFSSPMCLQETPEGISSFCCRVPPSIQLSSVLAISPSI